MSARATRTDVATVRIPIGEAVLEGILTVPPGALGVVVFAHGSGSGRFSPRNRAVAEVLVHASLATLLTDLLTAEEAAEDAETGRLRFDVRLLGDRVIGMIDWLASGAADSARAAGAGGAGVGSPVVRDLPVGGFGASTGAAAALIAAAQRPDRVGAVVSRGGRPDLAGDVLPHVRAPTLLIVGSLDTDVIKLNQFAQRHLGGPSRLEIVPGASHLFEEPGTLARVAALARDWFVSFLGRGRPEGDTPAR